MKRTREESTPAKDGKGEEVLSVGVGGEKNTGGGSTADTRSGRDALADDGVPPSKTPDDDPPPSRKKAATAATAANSKAAAEIEAGAGVGRGAAAAAAAGAGAGAREEVVEPPPPDVEGIPNETLFVGNLSYRVSEAVIIKLFTPFGKVVREQFCYHMVGPRRGEPRGFCFVEYSNVEDAAKAIRALHGRNLYGRPLRVRFMTVEGKGRMDYSTGDSNKSSSGFATQGSGAKIPPAAGAASEAGAGVTKLALDKKVALLKLKLREAQKGRNR
eukprot:g5212.t1